MAKKIKKKLREREVIETNVKKGFEKPNWLKSY